MDLWTQQVLDAMLRQNGAVPQGAPYANPNFTMPGATPRYSPFQLSGGGAVPPVQGNLPVPVAGGGLPMVPPQPPMIDVPPGAAAMPEAPGLLSRILGPLFSPLGLAGLGIGAAAYADPGDSKHFDPFLGVNPNDESDDLGATSIGKSLTRGAAHIGNTEADIISWLGENGPLGYLFSTKGERDARAKPPEEGDIALPALGHMPEGSPEYVIPGQGGSGLNSALDTLMQVMAAGKPGKTELPEDLKGNMDKAAFWNALANPGGPWINTSAVNTVMAGLSGSKLKQQLMGLELDQNNTKNTMDWLKSYANTGVDVEKAKADAAKDNFKIHSSKNGFLVEMNEGDKKVLKPISGNIFGPQAGSKLSIMGGKFEAGNPLVSELEIVKNLADVGILNDVLMEHSKDLMAATKGIEDPKQMQEAQILAVARAMHVNPKFKAAMQQKYLSAMGTPMGKPAYDMDNYPPPTTDEDTFMRGLGQ